MVIQLKKRNSGFFEVSPVDSWEVQPRDDYWYIGAKINTRRLLNDVEARFLNALYGIGIFFQISNHVVTIRDWINGVQQDALFQLAEDFGLKIIPE